MILLVLLGMVVGILSSGSGLGGGFLVVPLMIFLGHEAKIAVGTSFVFILMVAMSSVLAHYRLGNIDIKTGLVMALGGMIGAQIGPHLLQHLSDQNYKRIFSALLIITAIWLFASSFNSSKGELDFLSSNKPNGEGAFSKFVDPTGTPLNQTEHHGTFTIDRVCPSAIRTFGFKLIGDMNLIVPEISLAIAFVKYGFYIF